MANPRPGDPDYLEYREHIRQSRKEARANVKAAQDAANAAAAANAPPAAARPLDNLVLGLPNDSVPPQPATPTTPTAGQDECAALTAAIANLTSQPQIKQYLAPVVGVKSDGTIQLGQANLNLPTATADRDLAILRGIAAIAKSVQPTYQAFDLLDFDKNDDGVWGFNTVSDTFLIPNYLNNLYRQIFDSFSILAEGVAHTTSTPLELPNYHDPVAPADDSSAANLTDFDGTLSIKQVKVHLPTIASEVYTELFKVVSMAVEFAFEAGQRHRASFPVPEITITDAKGNKKVLTSGDLFADDTPAPKAADTTETDPTTIDPATPDTIPNAATDPVTDPIDVLDIPDGNDEDTTTSLIATVTTDTTTTDPETDPDYSAVLDDTTDTTAPDNADTALIDLLLNPEPVELPDFEASPSDSGGVDTSGNSTPSQADIDAWIQAHLPKYMLDSLYDGTLKRKRKKVPIPAGFEPAFELLFEVQMQLVAMVFEGFRRDELFFPHTQSAQPSPEEDPAITRGKKKVRVPRNQAEHALYKADQAQLHLDLTEQAGGTTITYTGKGKRTWDWASLVFQSATGKVRSLDVPYPNQAAIKSWASAQDRILVWGSSVAEITWVPDTSNQSNQSRENKPQKLECYSDTFDDATAILNQVIQLSNKNSDFSALKIATYNSKKLLGIQPMQLVKVLYYDPTLPRKTNGSIKGVVLWKGALKDTVGANINNTSQTLAKSTFNTNTFPVLTVKPQTLNTQTFPVETIKPQTLNPKKL